MMKRVAAILAALALLLFGVAGGAAGGIALYRHINEAQRCDLTVARDLSFSSPEARESVVARVFGPSCDRAIGVYDIRAEDGHPVWAWTAPLPQAFGNVFAPKEHKEMREFLERWATPTLTSTQHAPTWVDLGPGDTTLDQLTYDDIRARNLPMLCHASGVGRETCVFWEPAAGSAGHLLDRDLEES